MSVVGWGGEAMAAARTTARRVTTHGATTGAAWGGAKYAAERTAARRAAGSAERITKRSGKNMWKQFRSGKGVTGIDNKMANGVINSRAGKFVGRHPYMVGGGIVGATAMSNSMGPGRAGSPKGNAAQARGIYGF